MKKEHLNCQQARDQLDLLIEAMVDARIQAESDSSLGTAEGEEKYKLEHNAFEPAGPLKVHLAECADCHNYQLANRVIIEAARALPKLVADEALTQSIMAMVQASQESEMTSGRCNFVITKEINAVNTDDVSFISDGSISARSHRFLNKRCPKYSPCKIPAVWPPLSWSSP